MLSQINLRSVFKIIAIIFVGLFQVSVMPYFSFGQAIGNLILIAMIIFVFKKEYLKAFLWGLIGGFILDVSLGIGFGPFIISLSVVFFVLYIWQEKFFQDDVYIFSLITIFISSIILDIVFIIVSEIIGQDLTLAVFWPLILKQAAYNTILLAIIYPLYHYLDKKLFPQPEMKLPQI